MNTEPSHGPIHFCAPTKILWRTIRGMIPYKTNYGAGALARFKACESLFADFGLSIPGDIGSVSSLGTAKFQFTPRP
ncbi:Ribosomal protein L13 [Macleaya cordata]|uniref:Ribosomal protein L13 n=1 Tax=Macleaya cordata TaxID=56857 RepID=A0A200QKJ9_MACCD|nr:Ribosomal protein L13 [Macleaya cordata]